MFCRRICCCCFSESKNSGTENSVTLTQAQIVTVQPKPTTSTAAETKASSNANNRLTTNESYNHGIDNRALDIEEPDDDVEVHKPPQRGLPRGNDDFATAVADMVIDDYTSEAGVDTSEQFDKIDSNVITLANENDVDRHKTDDGMKTVDDEEEEEAAKPVDFSSVHDSLHSDAVLKSPAKPPRQLQVVAQNLESEEPSQTTPKICEIEQESIDAQHQAVPLEAVACKPETKKKISNTSDDDETTASTDLEMLSTGQPSNPPGKKPTMYGDLGESDSSEEESESLSNPAILNKKRVSLKHTDVVITRVSAVDYSTRPSSSIVHLPQSNPMILSDEEFSEKAV